MPMPLPEFGPVRLKADRCLSKGVGRGMIGFILDVYEDGYEVEFSRPDGTTIAWFAVKTEDTEPAPEARYRSSERTSV